jgi:hypothetical protein
MTVLQNLLIKISLKNLEATANKIKEGAKSVKNLKTLEQIASYVVCFLNCKLKYELSSVLNITKSIIECLDLNKEFIGGP